MVTRTEAPTIAELLKEKRGTGRKVDAYSKLGVTSTTYDSWEGDVYIPDDQYAPALAAHLGISEQEIVWLLYKNRERRRRDMGVYLVSPALNVTDLHSVWAA